MILMKATFTKSWKASTQPRKQRKYRHNAPLHIAGQFLAAHLSKELHGKHGVRSLRVREGDKVRILRGQHKDKEGKIERVDLKNGKIYVAKIEQLRKDGGKAPFPLEPSNLLLVELVTDKRRLPQAEKK